jgi:muconate cycloisomerase
MRLYGFRCVKLKLGGANDVRACRLARAVLGKNCDIRVDVNMGWSTTEAAYKMAKIRDYGIRFFEAPIAPYDIDGLTFLANKIGGVMIDEGFHDRNSLETLIARKACNAVNVRIAKCGGLVAAFARCRDALKEGLTVQIGCQTGESSLLSAAHLHLLRACGNITYGESCFGKHLLKEDPAQPALQFGYGGRPPTIPPGYGFGVTIDEETLAKWSVKAAGQMAAGDGA